LLFDLHQHCALGTLSDTRGYYGSSLGGARLIFVLACPPAHL